MGPGGNVPVGAAVGLVVLAANCTGNGLELPPELLTMMLVARFALMLLPDGGMFTSRLVFEPVPTSDNTKVLPPLVRVTAVPKDEGGEPKLPPVIVTTCPQVSARELDTPLIVGAGTDV